MSVLLLSGCGTFSLLSDGIKKVFDSKTNTRYYEKKSRFIVNQLIDQIEIEEESSNFIINKVAVLDLVDRKGKVSELGRYISLKIVNEISKNKHFRLVPRRDLLNTMNRFGIELNNIEVSALRELGEALEIEVIIAGRIIDIGTNLDVNVKSIDIRTGEIIASASESLVRSDFATEMLQKY